VAIFSFISHNWSNLDNSKLLGRQITDRSALSSKCSVVSESGRVLDVSSVRDILSPVVKGVSHEW